MYANERYQPPHSRGVSIGAALAINAVIIAGLIYSAPQFIAKQLPPTFTGRNIPIDPVPPPEPPKPMPKIEKHPTATMPLPTAPKPVVPTTTDNLTTTTNVIPENLPPIAQPPVDPGPIATPEPPKALPPLIGPAQDPRYARDFQPDYPSQELRSQRDGVVSIRVLIGIDGRVKQVEQVSATSTAFFEATKRQALGKWRFKPATRGGVPQESWKVMNVRFEISSVQ